ncbi:MULTISPECIES: hypothetical protein [Nonomuraea]|uniref:Uncharacterized protein n=1 Tax=Nonomuraea mangrovi TaxID=2316207 RepID=A0ABW4SR50_9ACTN
MKFIVATLSLSLFFLVGLVSPAQASDNPSYVCTTVDLSDDGDLTGIRCRPSGGAPATGPIVGPFAVWSPLRLLQIIICHSGQAYTPDGIIGTDCRSIF